MYIVQIPILLANSLDGSLLVAVLTFLGGKERERWRNKQKPTSLANSLDGSLLVDVLTISREWTSPRPR